MSKSNFVDGLLEDGESTDIVSTVPYENIETDEVLLVVSNNSKSLIKELSDLYIGEDLVEKYPFIHRMLEIENMSLGLLATQLRFTKHLAEQQFRALNDGGIGISSYRQMELFFMIQDKAVKLMHEFVAYVRSMPTYMKTIEQDINDVEGKVIDISDGVVVNDGNNPNVIQYKGSRTLIEEVEAAMINVDLKRDEINTSTKTNKKQKLSWRLKELEDEDLTKEEIELQLKKDNKNGILYDDDMN